jgi:hypothetical protein
VVNPSGEIVCCLRCGRDTRAKCGYCVICRGEGVSTTEHLDRDSRDLRALGGDPHDFESDDTSDSRYHGDGYDG